MKASTTKGNERGGINIKKNDIIILILHFSKNKHKMIKKIGKVDLYAFLRKEWKLKERLNLCGFKIRIP